MLIRTSEMNPVHDKSKEIIANRKHKSKAKHNFNGPRSGNKWDVTASSCPSSVGTSRDYLGDDEIKATLPLTKQEDVEQQNRRDSREKSPGTTRRPKRYAGHNRNIRPGNESKTLSCISAIQNKNVDLFADMRLVRGEKLKDKFMENGSKSITDTISNTNGMSAQKENGGISTSAVSNSNLDPNSSLSFKHSAYPTKYTKSNRTNTSRKKTFKLKNKFKSCREIDVDIGKENIESMDIPDQPPQDLHSQIVGQDQKELRCVNSEMSTDSNKREGNVTGDINDHSSVMTIQNNVPSRSKRNNNNQRTAQNRPRSQNNRSHFEKNYVKFNKVTTSKKGKGSDVGKRQEHGDPAYTTHQRKNNGHMSAPSLDTAAEVVSDSENEKVSVFPKKHSPINTYLNRKGKDIGLSKRRVPEDSSYVTEEIRKSFIHGYSNSKAGTAAVDSHSYSVSIGAVGLANEDQDYSLEQSCNSSNTEHPLQQSLCDYDVNANKTKLQGRKGNRFNKQNYRDPNKSFISESSYAISQHVEIDISTQNSAKEFSEVVSPCNVKCPEKISESGRQKSLQKENRPISKADKLDRDDVVFNDVGSNSISVVSSDLGSVDNNVLVVKIPAQTDLQEKGQEGSKITNLAVTSSETCDVPKGSAITGLGESNSGDTVVTTNAAGAALLHRLSVRTEVDATVVASKSSHNSIDCNSVRTVPNQDSRVEEEDAESTSLADTSSLAKSSHTVEPICSQQAISEFDKDQKQNIPIPPPSSPSIGTSQTGYYFNNGTNFTQDVSGNMLGRSYNYSMMPSMISAPPYPDNLPQNNIADPHLETSSGQGHLPQQQPRPLDQQQFNYPSYCYGGMPLPLSPYGHSYLSYSQCQQFGLSAPMAAPVPAALTVGYQQEFINGTAFFTPIYESDFAESGYDNIYAVDGEGQDAGNQSVDGYSHHLIDDERKEFDGRNKKIHSQGKIINRKNIKFRKKRSAKKNQ